MDWVRVLYVVGFGHHLIGGWEVEEVEVRGRSLIAIVMTMDEKGMSKGEAIIVVEAMEIGMTMTRQTGAKMLRLRHFASSM